MDAIRKLLSKNDEKILVWWSELRKSTTINAVIRIILVCPKGNYLSKREFPKLILTLVILPLQQYKSQDYLRGRKHVPCFYRVRETRVKVWENEKCCANSSQLIQGHNHS